MSSNYQAQQLPKAKYGLFESLPQDLIKTGTVFWFQFFFVWDIIWKQMIITIIYI